MRYVVTAEPGRMELREGEPPTPGPGEALVRVEVVGLCGSDYHLYDGSHPYARFPQIQGHEIVGTIESFASGYDGPLHRGDRVAVDPLLPCNTCFACRRGRYNCCTELRVMGAHVPGGLTELLTVSTGRLQCTGDLRPSVAVLTEPITIGLQCVHRAEIAATDRVVVIGAGPIGQAAMLGALDRGAQLLVADREPSRLARAKALGAHRVVNTSEEDLATAATDFTSGDGPRVVIEATGVPALVRQSIELVAHSGTVVIVGISLDEVAIPVSEFSRKEINVLGSRNSAGLFGEAAALVTKYADRLSGLVTHDFPLSETGAAIEFAAAHPDEVEKVVIRVSD